MTHHSPTTSLVHGCDNLQRATVFVAGDMMLDEFIYGAASRISPEAPIPVLSIERETSMLGGAGNVVRNIASLGAACHAVSLTGEDDTAASIATLLDAEPRTSITHLQETGRITPRKIRYIAGMQQLLRADHESTHSQRDETIQHYLDAARTHLSHCNAVILSDYRKGSLPPVIIRALIKEANAARIPVLVDPKQWDASLYEGATLLSPNEKEIGLLTNQEFDNDTAMIEAAQSLCKQHKIQHILITRGAKGMMLISADGLQQQIRANAREVYDVSGAGDTVIATLACALGAGLSLPDAATLANIAAGIVVGRVGTASISRTDLKTALHTSKLTRGSDKILSRQDAIAQVQRWQKDGQRVGFTNGCFDVVHAGHISSLNHCKQHCDRLVIAVNSDDSVKRLKGPTRPVNQEMDRAMLLAALQDIDLVTIFREDTPVELLHALRPDVLMKGEDYQKHEIVGADFVESYGGSVERIPLVDGYSSTNTIDKIRNA